MGHLRPKMIMQEEDLPMAFDNGLWSGRSVVLSDLKTCTHNMGIKNQIEIL